MMMEHHLQALVFIIYFVSPTSCSTMFTSRVFRIPRYNRGAD